MPSSTPPGLLDRHLARTDYTSPETATPVSPDSPANLRYVVDGDDGHDFGAHGDSDNRAHQRSAQLWASHHHGLLATTGTGRSRSHHRGLATPSQTETPDPSPDLLISVQPVRMIWPLGGISGVEA